MPQLDERRAKILDDGTEFFRRDAVQDVMLAHHVHNFAQTLAILGDCPLPLRLIRAAAVLVFRRIVTFGLVRRFGRDFRRNRLLFLLQIIVIDGRSNEKLGTGIIKPLQLSGIGYSRTVITDMLHTP